MTAWPKLPEATDDLPNVRKHQDRLKTTHWGPWDVTECYATSARERCAQCREYSWLNPRVSQHRKCSGSRTKVLIRNALKLYFIAQHIITNLLHVSLKRFHFMMTSTLSYWKTPQIPLLGNEDSHPYGNRRAYPTYFEFRGQLVTRKYLFLHWLDKILNNCLRNLKISFPLFCFSSLWSLPAFGLWLILRSVSTIIPLTTLDDDSMVSKVYRLINLLFCFAKVL